MAAQLGHALLAAPAVDNRASFFCGATGASVKITREHAFLGERYHRIARRCGKAKAHVAVTRSILVIIWHLLADPEARYTDLGHGYYRARTHTDRKLRNHVRQIQALSFAGTLTKAA